MSRALHRPRHMVPNAPSLICARNRAMLLGVFVALTASAKAPEEPSSNVIAIEVGLVRITPTRPGTNQTWAIPGPQKITHAR